MIGEQFSPSPPVSTALLPRHDLVAALDRASTAAKVTLVSAPAGSGKSSLLRQWAGDVADHRRIASLSVSRGERDPQRFWLALLKAIGAPDIAATPTFDADAIVDRVLDTLDGPAVLVIDDLHELESPEAYAGLEALIERLDDDVRLVLASRRDPRLRLHHLRLEGELAELRVADLRFSEAEAAALLAASGVKLGEDDLTTLYERTEGWAAGLRLAAIALRGHSAPAEFVAAFSGSNRTVAEYLLAEMLDRQPEQVRRLLLRTSIVERFNGPLADLLSGEVGTQETFQALEDANAFVVSLDAERTWFRYHHLFGDLLRVELRRTTPAEVADLHSRAAGWFAEQALPAEAVRHAQAAEDWARAARLLADHALSLALDGQEPTIHELLKAFPPDALEADPELAIVSAASELAQGSLPEAAGYLTLAEDRAEFVAQDRRSRFDVSLAATRLSLARRRGDFSDVVEQVELLSRPAGLRSHAEVALGGELRAFALMNLGIVEMWSLQLNAAREHLREAAETARRIGRPYLEVGCRAHLGFACVDESFASGRARCEEAIALADRHGWRGEQVVAVALASLGGTLTFCGEYERAGALLDDAEQALRPGIEPATALLAHLSRGMWACGRGRWAEAVTQFRAGEQMQALLVTQHALAAQLRAFRVAALLRLDRLDDARESVRGLDDWGESLMALASVRLAEQDFAGVVDVLAPIFDGEARVIHEFTTVQALMLAAQAYVELADRRASEAAVERALDLAERDRLVLPFVMAGGSELLDRHPRHATAHAQLLTDLLEILAGGAAPVETDVTPLSEPLSPGELRVLGHLPSNLSVPEISRELFLSMNTVKTHTRHIFAKLGAHNRTEAVERARELGLLGRRPR
jgi:LuxR family maltose regulon positive regulatory protein